MIGLPNPWLILAGALAIGGAYLAGDLRGATRGRNEVQVQWDKEEGLRARRASENAQRGRDTDNQLQAAADEERKRNAKTLAGLDARLADATDRLSKRPARPGLADSGYAAPGTGADARCTGAGLYRDDGLFLRRQADLWQRVRIQRDTCYASYAEAQAAIAKLSGSASAAPAAAAKE